MNELSIIVPCLASIEGLHEFIDELVEYLIENPGDVETIVVTNKNLSQNITIADYVKTKYPWLKFRVLQKIGRSNSYGVIARLGIAYSNSRYAVLVSPYGEDDISFIGEMLSLIRKGSQVVQATRFTLPEDSQTVQSIYSWVINYINSYETVP